MYYKNIKRSPRKFKKKWRYILQGDRYDFLSLGQKLWLIKGLVNPKHRDEIIKKTIENENNNSL